MKPRKRIRRALKTPILSLSAIALLASASAVAGQAVQGTALDASSGRPIEGAFVSVIDSSGQDVASTLSGPDGAFLIHVFVRGSYRLRVERIGFATWTSSPFDAGTGVEVARSLMIPVRPIDLSELQVSVESRCARRAGAGPELLRVWEEARKALEVTRWSEANPAVRFELRRWIRVLQPRTYEVVREETSNVLKTGRSSFVSLPATLLAESGYVQKEDDALRFFGPDSEVLLSDAFFDDHCFTLVPGELETADLIGLEFEPVERTDAPNVRGVLWLDPLSAELRFMEFEYTQLHRVDIPADTWSGGRVEFRRGPSGAWFVSRWWIRTPVVQRRIRPTLRRGARGNFLTTRLSDAVDAYREFGGEVLKIALEDGSEIALGEWGTLVGRAMGFDGQQPLDGARVYLAGTDHEAVTDSVGRFRLDFVAPGPYTLAVEHSDPRLQGFPGIELTVSVRGEESMRLRLAISADHVVSTLCAGRRESQADSDEGDEGYGSVLLGRIVDEESGLLLPGAVVWLRSEGMEDADPVRADDEGYFLVCGLQPTSSLQLQAASLGRVGEPVEVEVPANRLLLRDLSVAPSTLAAASEVSETTASLRGVVRSAETGDPVAGAIVRLLGVNEERITGGDGTFLIADLPSGPHRIVTEHLGMSSDTAEVVLTTGTLSLALFTLETDPVQLPELNVQVDRTLRNLRLAGYYERLDLGLGDFITREDLERRDIITNLRRIPGVRVSQCIRTAPDRLADVAGGAGRDTGGQQDPTTGDLEVLPGFGTRVASCWDVEIGRLRLSQICRPLVFLNGQPLSGFADETMIQLTGENPMTMIAKMPRDMIEGIEVHRNAATAPPQYHGFGSACGVVLVWTRGRRSS
jgi:hypothetical protein